MSTTFGLALAMPDGTVLEYHDLSWSEARELGRLADHDDINYSFGLEAV